MGSIMKKIILNQKSYLLYDEMIEFKNNFDKLKSKDYEFILFPPVHYLSMFNNSKYPVGTQNFYTYKTGSFTGEINLEALKFMGINYTLIGHYERRKFIFEPYEIAKEKLFKSLSSKCNTILCVGEQRKTLKPFNYIKKEINFYLKSIESNALKYLSIAYIPNWSVGTGDKTTEKIIKIIESIKKYMKSKYKIDVEVYYGGNIENGNAKEIMDICDGLVLDKYSIDIKLLKELLKEL